MIVEVVDRKLYDVPLRKIQDEGLRPTGLGARLSGPRVSSHVHVQVGCKNSAVHTTSRQPPKRPPWIYVHDSLLLPPSTSPFWICGHGGIFL